VELAFTRGIYFDSNLAISRMIVALRTIAESVLMSDVFSNLPANAYDF